MATEIEVLQLPTAEVIQAAEAAAIAAKVDAEQAKADAVAAAASVPTEESITTQIEAVVAASIGSVDSLIAERFAPLPDEDAVALSVVSDADYVATPSLGVVGGTLIKPARVGGGTTGDPDVEFDPRFRYSGGPSGKGISADWIAPANDLAGVSLLLNPEFTTSRGVSKIMLKVKPTTTNLEYRVTIGETWERAELHRTPVTSGVTYYIVLDLATARSRRIKLELLTAQFGGVVVPAGETITRTADRPLMVCIADSFGGGAGNEPPNGASRLETFPNYVAQALGYDLTNLSIGGTGWGITSTPFEQRILPALQMSPAFLLLVGSRNNLTDGNTAYAAARAGLALVTDVPVVRVGGPAQTPFSVVNAAVRDAANENSLRFIDVLDVVSGELTGTDGVHPTFAGHWALAVALLARMDFPDVQRRIAAITRTAPGITLTATPNGSAAVGANVTLTATVQSGVAGVVEFRAGSTVLGRSTIAGGTASLTTSGLAMGTYQLSGKVVPADKSAYKPALSDVVGFTVTAATLSDIITTNLLAELDVAQLSSLADGAAVTSMTPTRGSKLDALVQGSAGAQMAYLANAGDNKAAIKQVGLRGLPAPSWATPLAAGAQVTLFIAVKIVAGSATGSRYISNYLSSGTGVRLNLSAAGTLALTAQASAGLTNSPPLLGRWMIFAIRLEADSRATVFQNRLTGDVLNVSHATTAYAGLGIGGGSGGSDGEIHHRGQYVYAGGMSDTDIQAMMVYLANRHGATLD
jgi:hypothetical protein